MLAIFAWKIHQKLLITDSNNIMGLVFKKLMGTIYKMTKKNPKFC